LAFQPDGGKNVRNSLRLQPEREYPILCHFRYRIVGTAFPDWDKFGNRGF
jgi:hypothetical protein